MENQTTFLQRIRMPALVIGVIGLAASAYGFKADHAQFAQSYLIGYLFWLALAGGSLALLMIHHLVSGRWGFVIQRPIEAAARTFPLMAVLFLPIVFSMHDLYHWTHADAVAHDHILQWKEPYLNTSAFLIRAAVFFGLFIVLAQLLTSWSRKLDTGEQAAATVKKLRAVSAPGLVAFGLAMSFASFDWVMSIEPHWFSSIYGALFMVGQGLSTFAFMAIMAVVIGRREPMKNVITTQQYHDIGNFMFAFTILWTYMAFGQYIIIWSGNLPEFTKWYLHRSNSGGYHWLTISYVLFAANFVIPFLMMLFRNNKRNPNRLIKVAFWVLAVRIIEYYWLVGPEFRKSAGDLHWLDAAAFAGVGGLWLFLFITNLNKRPVLVKHDPRFEEFAAGSGGGKH